MAGAANLIDLVAQETGLKKADAKAAVESVIGNIAAIAANESLTLRGFGTFKTKDYAAKAGRNPQTGQTIEIPAKSKLTFKSLA